MTANPTIPQREQQADVLLCGDGEAAKDGSDDEDEPQDVPEVVSAALVGRPRREGSDREEIATVGTETDGRDEQSLRSEYLKRDVEILAVQRRERKAPDGTGGGGSRS